MTSSRRDWLVLVAVVTLWVGAARAMAMFGAPLLPRALAAQLTLQSFFSLVLVVSTALGLALSFVLLKAPREDLGLRRPSGSAVGMATFWAPIVLVLSAYLAFKLALPTLLEELARGGRRAAEQNTGEFGRALVQSHVVTTVVWATVLTPVAEELMFRGGMWSLVRRVTLPLASTAQSLPPELLREGALGRGLGATRRYLCEGGVATLVTAAVFAWLHADQEGGAGIIRVVQTACLGLALGCARHASGSLLPPMALHALFNLLTIAKTRKWVLSPGWPPPFPIATLYWQLAAGCAVALAIWWLHRWPRLRTIEADLSVHVQRPFPSVHQAVAVPSRDAAAGDHHGALSATEIDDALGHLPATVKALTRNVSGSWEIADEGTGTRLGWSLQLELVSPFARVVAGLLRRAVKLAIQAALERTRDQLERQDTSSPLV
ncbi:MAG: CPBP family intramembrane metalloprotease [Deltaproteobacteria bacterium]|nr:CPBP family intramembrane metalloprotease [Deltaproteobacteria bacterium]